MQIFPVYKLGQDTPGAIPAVGAEEVFPYTPAPELGYHHWLFGPDDDSLTPYGGSATLFAQAGGAQVWEENYVTLPGYNNALATDIADAAVQTIYGVVRYQPVASKSSILIGNLSATLQGSGVWVSSSGNISTVVRTASNDPAIVGFGAPPGVVPGDWIFVGLSVRSEGGVAVTRTQVGPNIQEFAWAQPKVNSGNNEIAIGNAYNSGAGYTPTPLDAAELIVHGSAADSVKQMLRVYSRSRVRMAARGINLK